MIKPFDINVVAVFIKVYLLILICAGCGSSKKINKDFVYFEKGTDTVSTQRIETIIQANDLLSIQVFSRTLNQDQAAIFNIPAAAGSTPQQGYQVNQDGNIDMPVIGTVKAAGLTKDQLQSSLGQKLMNYVKNPNVLIRFMQFNVNVLGEVRSPGTQKFQVDRVTIVDAISAAGDLTDYGKREDVKVIREVSGKRIYYNVDLRNKNLFESPVYVLQPNDIVYVGPNKYKLKNVSIDQQKQQRTGLFLSVISVLISIASLVIFALN